MKQECRIYSGFDRRGHVNAAVYAPGEHCDAFPGSPVFPETWTIIYWYPGRDEEIGVFANHAECDHDAKKRGLKPYPHDALPMRHYARFAS
jgi:hypothetical protein